MERILEKIKSITQATISNAQPYLARLKSLNQAYQGLSLSDTKNQLKGKNSKKIYNSVKIATARLAKITQISENLIGLQPIIIKKEGNDLSPSERKAQLATKVANLYLNRIKFKKLFIEKFILDACVTGTPIAKIGVKEEKGIILPDILRISPFNFFPDPSVDTMDEASFTIEIIPIRKSKLKAIEKVANLQNLDNIHYVSSPTLSPIAGTNYLTEIRQERKQTDTNSFTNDWAILVDYWFIDDPLDNGSYGVWNIMFDYNSNTIVRELQPSPFSHGKLPYVRGQIFPVPESQNPMSIAESILPEQEEYSHFKKQIRTNASLAGNLALLISRNAGIDKESLLTNQVGRIIMGNIIGENAIRQLQIRPIIGELASALQFIDREIQETSGANSMLLALSAPSTATAAEILKSEGNTNLDILSTLLITTFLEPLFEQYWANLKDYFTGITTSDGETITKEDIDDDFIVTVTDLQIKANLQAIASKLITTMAMFSQAKIPLNYSYFGKLIALGLGIPIDMADRLFGNEAVVTPQDNQNAQMLQQSQEGNAEVPPNQPPPPVELNPEMFLDQAPPNYQPIPPEEIYIDKEGF